MQLAGVPTWEESLSVRQGNILLLGDTRKLEPATVLPFGEAVKFFAGCRNLGHSCHADGGSMFLQI